MTKRFAKLRGPGLSRQGVALLSIVVAVAAVFYAGQRSFLMAQEKRIDVAGEPGADFGEKLNSCLRRLGPQGGVCDTTSISGQQTAKTDPFTNTNGRVAVLLGNVTIETAKGWALPDHVELAGKGRGTVLRLAAGANSDLISNAAGKAGNQGIALHDLTLDGNSANQTGTVSTVHLKHVTDLSIEHVRVVNSVIHGIALDDGCLRAKLLNNTITGVKKGSGIRAGNTPPAGQVAFLEIRGNEISQVAAADGIFVLGATAAGEHTHDINISGNTLTGVKDTSIEVGDGSQKVTVTDNKVVLSQAPGGSSGSTGISVRSAQDVRVVGNNVAGDSAEHEQVGLLVWSPATDKGGTLAKVALENNDISAIGGEGIKVHSGDGIRLIRNKVKHCKKNNITVTQKATGVTQEGNIQEQ